MDTGRGVTSARAGTSYGDGGGATTAMARIAGSAVRRQAQTAAKPGLGSLVREAGHRWGDPGVRRAEAALVARGGTGFACGVVWRVWGDPGWPGVAQGGPAFRSAGWVKSALARAGHQNSAGVESSYRC